ncbi:Metalloendoproteinase 1 [Morella rubra]|uniref:Metalloendoproteinase 1 n=1 Tax=Morella rubra TaxID=262757 RepID=A0A6A1VW74_9ROSI|nr:Metalloendoproteinase 1 [Morella rubra]
MVFLSLPRPCFPARTAPDLSTVITVVHNATWHDFDRFIDAGKGSHVNGMSELKKYFNRFGYLPIPDKNFTDMFDAQFESAVILYQRNLGLPVTGFLDSDTISTIMSPRCGMSDASHSLHTTRHFAYFNGKPRWLRASPLKLTYAFSLYNMIDYLSLSEIRAVFRRSFSRWESVIPVSFTETRDYQSADIRIGFYLGDHGDGQPFDGVLGVLAHAFSPENGRLHLDAAETWAVDFQSVKSKVAVDLESVATHEIGHILGLAHTSVKEAIMYPSLSPRTKKSDLKLDDVRGIQALYGSNPNFKFSSLMESENSLNKAIGLDGRFSKLQVLVMGAGIKGHERPAERDPNETKWAGWNSTPNSSAWQRICFTLIWGWIQSSKVSLTIQGSSTACLYFNASANTSPCSMLNSSPPLFFNLGLPVTGFLDSISMSPRRSFSRWESVIPVSFTETRDYQSADIRIGFYLGDHGDGQPFDGVLGVLAHAFSPENGRLHLDAAETWAVDFQSVKSKVAVDLESVATHEIGHILGLAHTSVKEAIMYPSLSPRTKKSDLKLDDVRGIQALYGSNPNFKFSSLMESENSLNKAIGLDGRFSKLQVLVMGAGIKGHERPAERDPNETKWAGWNSTPNSSAWQRICFTLIWGWIQSSKVSLTIQACNRILNRASLSSIKSAVRSNVRTSPLAAPTAPRVPLPSRSTSSPLPRFSLSRCPVELGSVQSLLPLHSAVAVSRMTSCLSTTSRSCRALSQGTLCCTSPGL